jgi:uncharacterized linocin/CFP29 family protein
MNHLHRELAPISDEAWSEIEREADRTLRHYLTGRRVIDFTGPKGWSHAAEPTGRVNQLSPAPSASVTASARGAQPLVELRSPFTLQRAELDAIGRGARDADLDPVTDAARHLAITEDSAIFEGYAAAAIGGIGQCTTHETLHISDDYSDYPGLVARAVATLQRSGIGGPYAIVLGPRCHTGVIETTEHGGYPLLEHLRLILNGPALWAPAVDGAIVLTTRGDDYEIVVGEDVAIGYASHDAETVQLYLEETFTFRVLTPEAAVALRYV